MTAVATGIAVWILVLLALMGAVLGTVRGSLGSCLVAAGVMVTAAVFSVMGSPGSWWGHVETGVFAVCALVWVELWRFRRRERRRRREDGDGRGPRG
jgi:hypothetical protein